MGIKNEIMNSFGYYGTQAKLKIESAQKRGMQEEIQKLKLELRDHSRRAYEEQMRDRSELFNENQRLCRKVEQLRKIIDSNNIPVVFE